MRVAISGANGFVGRWLQRDLEAADHTVVPLPSDVDIRDVDGVRRWLETGEPDAVAHLAAVSFGPDARARPEEAISINVGGTVNVLETLRRLATPPVVLVAGSSEVYGRPEPSDLPLHEGSRLSPNGPYGETKLAQEAIGIAAAQRYGLSVTVTRSFNHIGPGQRVDFVVPALTRRLLAVRSREADGVRVGNLDVRRDLTDVRDVVRAYRLLLESASRRESVAGGTVVNVCSGSSISIRDILGRLARRLGVEPRIAIDPSLVRANDAPEIRGDRSAIETLVGWRPEIDLDRTLDDIVAAELSAARS